MHIELMSKEAAEDIAELLNLSIGSSIAHFGTTPTSAQEVLEDWYAAGETYPWLIGRNTKGEFMGFAKGSAWKTRKAYRWTVETGIYLAAGARGIGAGKELYTKLFDLLTRQGYCIALAGVSLPNDASVGLHESIGMTAVGDIDPAGFKLGGWIPVRLYQKRLSQMLPDTIPGHIRAVTSVWEELENERLEGNPVHG